MTANLINYYVLTFNGLLSFLPPRWHICILIETSGQASFTKYRFRVWEFQHPPRPLREVVRPSGLSQIPLYIQAHTLAILGGELSWKGRGLVVSHPWLSAIK